MALTEGKRAGEFLLTEANGYRSREEVTVAASQKLVAGAVVGKITTGGKFAEYNNGASDGTQAAAGILWEAVDALTGTPADKRGVIIARDAEVNLDLLTWKSGASQGDIDAGVADLKALGIFCLKNSKHV